MAPDTDDRSIRSFFLLPFPLDHPSLHIDLGRWVWRGRTAPGALPTGTMAQAAGRHGTHPRRTAQERDLEPPSRARLRTGRVRARSPVRDGEHGRQPGHAPVGGSGGEDLGGQFGCRQ